MKTYWIASLLILCCCTAPGQKEIVRVPNEPENLYDFKQALIKYYSCTEANCYAAQLKHQTEIAHKLLQQSIASAKPGEKLAIVLDIDETSLSNWAVELHDDFGYVASDSNTCIALWCGRAIPETLAVYKAAIAANVAVFFITGRPETQRADTVSNLKAEGYDQFNQLYLRPVDHPSDQPVSVYKSGERAKIIQQGYRIILNMGDQMSDLEGEPMAEHSVKLPNPFYFLK